MAAPLLVWLLLPLLVAVSCLLYRVYQFACSSTAGAATVVVVEPVHYGK